MADEQGIVLIPPAPPDPVKKKKARAIARSHEQLKHDVRQAQQVSRYDVEEVAEKYSRAPSTFLAGIAGGVVGAASGIAVGTLATGTLIVTGPLGLALGAALGILAFRGRNFWRLEKTTGKAVAAAEFILSRINALPPDAPKDIRDSLYRDYEDVIHRYKLIAADTLDESSPQLPPGP